TVSTGAGQVSTVTLPGGATTNVTPFAGFPGEVRVARADVNHDGTDDLIAGAGPGTLGGHVKVLDGVTGQERFSFFAFEGFLGGVFVAGGDIDLDGFADVIVATDVGAAHVKVFSGRDGSLLRSFFAYEGFSGGVTVAAGDVDGDGRADVITGTATGATHVKVF